jgi:hypothetical protein
MKHGLQLPHFWKKKMINETSHNVDSHASFSIMLTLISSCTSISYMHNLLISFHKLNVTILKYASQMEKFPPCSKEGILPHS